MFARRAAAISSGGQFGRPTPGEGRFSLVAPITLPTLCDAIRDGQPMMRQP